MYKGQFRISYLESSISVVQGFVEFGETYFSSQEAFVTEGEYVPTYRYISEIEMYFSFLNKERQNKAD